MEAYNKIKETGRATERCKYCNDREVETNTFGETSLLVESSKDLKTQLSQTSEIKEVNLKRSE